VTLAGGLAVYFVIWWTVLFAVLPFGVRSQAETGEVTQGTDPGAPAAPRMRKVALITSVIAGVIFALVWYIWATFDL
jgi:predicted secreted protein